MQELTCPIGNSQVSTSILTTTTTTTPTTQELGTLVSRFYINFPNFKHAARRPYIVNKSPVFT
jgi:hypothetical protein